MQGNDHDVMGVVDFIGLNNSSIIFRAMNNACRLSHIQPSGTRHLHKPTQKEAFPSKYISKKNFSCSQDIKIK
jgi:hypothetical protein